MRTILLAVTAVLLLSCASNDPVAPQNNFRAVRDLSGRYTVTLSRAITSTSDASASWPQSDIWTFTAVTDSSVRLSRMAKTASGSFLPREYMLAPVNDTTLFGDGVTLTAASTSVATSVRGSIMVVVDATYTTATFTIAR